MSLRTCLIKNEKDETIRYRLRVTGATEECG